MYNMEIAFGTYKIRLEILLILIFLVWVTFGHALCACCKITFREGLENIKDALTPEEDEEEKMKAAEEEKMMVAESVSTTDSTVSPAIITEDITESFSNLTDVYGNDDKFNSIDIMNKMEFKPECCPNAYTTSQGCACMSADTYQYLIDRGGNNVPYSEY